MATTRLMSLPTGKGYTAFFEGKGYGVLLPEDAEKLREFFAERQEPAALEKTSSAS